MRWLAWPMMLAVAAALSGCDGSSGMDGGDVSDDDDPDAPAGIVIERAFPNLTFVQPVAMIQRVDDPTRWYVVEQRGRILWFDADDSVTSANVFMDIEDRVETGGERGLLGLAFSPGFETDGIVYASYTGPGLTSYLSRFEATADNVDEASEERLLEVPQEFDNHNGGHIIFGPDNYLYMGFGDGGSANDPENRAQDTTNLLGTIIRLDVSGETGYEIPVDNPFVAGVTCEDGFGDDNCAEIYAYGLRNPWRFNFDALTGELWAADVGQNDYEEVDIIVSGGNYGWPAREGANCNPNLSIECTDPDFIDPVAEYETDLGQSVTGGYVYRGAMLERSGQYIFGDFVSGNIFSLPEGGPEIVVEIESDLNISSFAEGADAELYALDYTQGEIYRLVSE